MNINDNKITYSSFIKAQKEANRLSKEHNRGFNVYKSGCGWMIGGVHITKEKKIKSFANLHQLLDLYKDDENDASVDLFIRDVEQQSVISESEEVGIDLNWILQNVSVKQGFEVGLSAANKKTYLVLDLTQDTNKLRLKMGGKFDVHIPLMKKQCDALISKSVRWHTWNSKSRDTNWLPNEWFYLVEENL